MWGTGLDMEISSVRTVNMHKYYTMPLGDILASPAW